MLLHIDGSKHRWFQDERWYDLIVILDDASSEIYYAQRPGESFLRDAEGRREGGQAPLDAGGTGDEGVGGADDSGLIAAGAGPQRAELWHLAGAAAARAAAGGDRDAGASQPVSA